MTVCACVWACVWYADHSLKLHTVGKTYVLFNIDLVHRNRRCDTSPLEYWGRRWNHFDWNILSFRASNDIGCNAKKTVDYSFLASYCMSGTRTCFNKHLYFAFKPQFWMYYLCGSPTFPGNITLHVSKWVLCKWNSPANSPANSPSGKPQLSWQDKPIPS